MTHRNRILAASAVLALASAVSAPALASGTAAGTQITNTAGVTCTINAIAQTGASATDTVTVDRFFALYACRNRQCDHCRYTGPDKSGRAVHADQHLQRPIRLWSCCQPDVCGGTVRGGADTFNLTGVAIYEDVDANGLLDGSIDTPISHLDEVPADAARSFFFVGDVPTGLAHAEAAGVIMVATALEAGVAGTQGAVVTQTVGANTAGVDTVFYDHQGPYDAQLDGKMTVLDDFTVTSATVTLTRTNQVIWNNFEGTTNAKALPTGLIEYCIIVSNAANSADAANLTITDQLASTLTYDSSFGVWVNGTVTNGVCNSDGTSTGAHAAGRITGMIGDLPAGTERTVRYRATVN